MGVSLKAGRREVLPRQKGPVCDSPGLQGRSCATGAIRTAFATRTWQRIEGLLIGDPVSGEGWSPNGSIS
jgi:hypothetical protein